MASQSCWSCLAPMDPRDGHRECPTCLGVAHVREDVENPCRAALDLPLEERACRAESLEQPEDSRAPALPPLVRDDRQGAGGHRKRVRAHSPERAQAHSLAAPATKRRRGGTRAPQAESHSEILAAIKGLSERMGMMEARHLPAGGGSSEPSRSSHDDLPSYQGESVEQADVLSLYAQGSLLDSNRPSEQEEHTSSLSQAGSVQVDIGDSEFSTADVLSRVLSAAELVGLSGPVEAPAPVLGVWAGIPIARPATVVPVASDYLQMLRRSWGNPAGPPQVNAGCRALIKDQFESDSGLTDMPPVEREMAALMSLGPARVTADPRCPVKECRKTDTLVCQSYNAAARAARSGSALTILLAAIRKSLDPEDKDTMSLVDSALIAHTQLTRDVGAAMSTAVMARRACLTRRSSLAVRGSRSVGPIVEQVVRGICQEAHIPHHSSPGPGGLTGPGELNLLPLNALSILPAGLGLCLKVGALPELQGLGVGSPSGTGRPAEAVSQLRLDSWIGCVSDQWVLATVANGYRIQFRCCPPPFSRVLMTVVKDPCQADILHKEILTLLEKKAIERVNTGAQHAGFYSKYFIIPKKDGGLRPVLDLRRLNAFLKVRPFKMLTTRQILVSIEREEWFTSLDLKEAYFHVPICLDHRQFLRFAFQGQAYQFRVLPFGLSLSPRVFTRVVAAALSPLQAAGMKILPYLDDWLICAQGRSQVMQDTQRVIQHVQNLGFRVNLDKSNLIPTQEATFVGLRLSSVTMSASLTPQRVLKLLTLASQFHLGRRLEMAQFQRLLGTIAAATVVVPLGLLRARPLQRWLNAFGLHPSRDRRVKLRVSRTFLHALRPWKDEALLTWGVPLGHIPSRRTVVSTDASLTGWGAVWEGRSVRGAWNPPWGDEHINVLELKAVHMALLELLPLIRNRYVLVRTDNTSVVYHINHQGGTRSQRCLQVARELLLWAFVHLPSLRAMYVPGVQNRAADLLSRTGPLPGEWRLHPEVVSQLWSRFGRAQADLFASSETTHCERWFSLGGHGAPLGQDALSQDWPVGLLYAFPPLPLIPHVLHRVLTGRHRVLLIAPRWPGRCWFPALLRLLQGQPWPLPVRADLLSQIDGKIWHPKPATLQLWAWPLLSPSLRN
ncbi:uncharacterized protein LOC143127104 [Alosa pseudoharengus]|uniref:uncharacterized protein LOC143127104 n=1 Tax=Alosa pseudoharengus TaxID=34774 RepID=UPI003F89005D